jgi:hypothetical protein
LRILRGSKKRRRIEMSLRISAPCTFVLASCLFGCSVSSEYMQQQIPPLPLSAVPDKATVVFIRPSGYGGRMKTVILDEHGRFLGEDWGETYFSVQVPAGDHVFLSWAENTAALHASLAPGKTYYVEVAPKMGAFSARVHLMAVTPHSESWGKLREWLSDSKQLVPNEPAGQAYLASRADDVKERLNRASAIWGEYKPDEIAERTIKAEDGQ